MLRNIVVTGLTVVAYVLVNQGKGNATSTDETLSLITHNSTEFVPVQTHSLATVEVAQTSTDEFFALDTADLNPDPDRLPITPVSQLTDVATTDWAYQALRALSEQYNCIEGYPDRTYQGERSLSRFEFAAQLQACFAQLEQQTASSTLDGLSSDDLATLQRLQAEFALELQSLQQQVGELETQVETLEANQFSPTARLNLLSSFNVSYAAAGGDILAEGIPLGDIKPTTRLPLRTLNRDGELVPLVGTVTEDPPITASQSTYVLFTFSGTGRDELSALLAMGNGDPPASVFSSAGFTSSFGVPYADSNPVTPSDENDIALFELKYSWPITNRLQLVIGPRILPYRHFDINPYTSVVRGSGGINFYQSTLANTGLSASGALVEWSVSRQVFVRLGYLARNDAALRYADGDGPSSPTRGLFNSTNSILAEVTYSPSRDFNLRLHYDRTRLDAPPPSPPGLPSQPFLLTSFRGAVDDGLGGSLNDVITHNFVLNFDWLLSSHFALFGRYSYSIAEIDPINPAIAEGQIDLQAVQFGMAFPDLGREGALATVAAVVPFDVVSGRSFLAAGYGDGGTQLDLLATYYLPLNDHVAIIPMVFATFSPNNFSENPPVYTTVLRTQFLF